MPLPSGPGPHRDDRMVGGHRVHLHAHQGKRRSRIEDAWAMVEGARFQTADAPDAKKGAGDARRVDAFAVFDGLGGVAHGQEAAWAAADRLARVLADADTPDTVLRHLNDAVRPTGGSTTATVLLTERPHHEVRQAWLLTIGDSSAYAALDGRPFGRLNPLDRVDRHMLSDWLGRPNITGHLISLTLRRGDTVVLCTDGADEVAGVDALEQVAEAAIEDTGAALDRLFEKILAAGAPDNATVMVVRC